MTDDRKFYKATRLDGTSFYDSTTKWQVGRITRHANPDLTAGVCSDGVLHVSDAPGETLIGGFWPCRLFEVEPRGPITAPEGHKYGCAAVKVVRELPAWQVFGPNGEAVVAVITRAATLSAAELDALVAAWAAARAATWDAARDAAREERTCADCCETVSELIAECRALRAEIDRLTHQLQMAEAVNDD